MQLPRAAITWLHGAPRVKKKGGEALNDGQVDYTVDSWMKASSGTRQS